MNFLNRFLRFKPLQELIGGAKRIVRMVLPMNRIISPNMDVGVTDYAFNDKARRAKAKGLELSGLLLKPLYSKITSWTMGRPPSFQLQSEFQNAIQSDAQDPNSDTSGAAPNDPAPDVPDMESKTPGMDQLAEWWRVNHSKVMASYEDSLGLADSYLVVNPDLTCTVLPPHVVTPIVNDDNFGEFIGWRVEIAYQHPTEPGRVQIRRDEYYADRRVQTVITDGKAPVIKNYRNLIGRIPVIHIPNNKGSDELFGHTEGEAFIPMLQMYGKVFEAAIEGNVRHGRPTPAIEKMGTSKAVDAFWSRFGKTRTINHPDGTTEIEQYLEWDADKLMTLAESAEFNWKSPDPFMTDVEKLLGLMYYLFVEHGEIPEAFLGSAIASSKASAEAQLIPLVKFIEKKRSYAQGWILELCQIVLGYLNVIDARVPVEVPTIRWDDLTSQDGQLTLQSIEWAFKEGLLDEETALMLMPVEVENPKEVLRKARKEREARQQQFNNQMDQRLADAEARAQAVDNQANQVNGQSASERQKSAA